jgi:hypothetical protein
MGVGVLLAGDGEETDGFLVVGGEGFHCC